MTTRAEHLDRLAKRLAHLEKRIKDAQATGHELSFDRAEAATLRWTLEQLKKNE